MVQKREAKAINKLYVREILSLSFVCGAYFFEFRGRNLVCFVIAYNFNGKYAPEAGKTCMHNAFFTRVDVCNNNFYMQETSYRCGATSYRCGAQVLYKLTEVFLSATARHRLLQSAISHEGSSERRW